MAERTRLPDFFHDEEAFEGDDFDDGFGDADDRDPDDDTYPDEEDPGCVLGDKCVCPHPYHTSDECATAEMMEEWATPAERRRSRG